MLLPVRDGARHLREAIASLEAQSHRDFEVIAVDDGSRDETPDVLAEWGARDPRVRVVSGGRRGLVAALETARSLARAPFLARMDADDVCEPRRLERQLALMDAEPDLAACGCLVRYFPEELLRDGALRYQAWLDRSVRSDEVARAMFVECPLPHPTFFLRASAVAAVGGYRDMGWPEDYDLVLKLWETGAPLAKVPEVLLRWRESEGRLSRTHRRYAPAAFRRCKAHFLARTLLAGGRHAVIWGAGPVGKAFARTLIETGPALRAFVEVDPRKIGQSVHGVPVLDTRAGLALEEDVHLAAVGQEGAREHIGGLLAEAGFREMEGWVAVA